MISPYRRAAEAIWAKYERYLAAPQMGNQDKQATIKTMEILIKNYCGPKQNPAHHQYYDEFE